MYIIYVYVYIRLHTYIHTYIRMHTCQGAGAAEDDGGACIRMYVHTWHVCIRTYIRI